jgi:hypothetical protein
MPGEVCVPAIGILYMLIDYKFPDPRCDKIHGGRRVPVRRWLSEEIDVGERNPRRRHRDAAACSLRLLPHGCLEHLQQRDL